MKLNNGKILSRLATLLLVVMLCMVGCQRLPVYTDYASFVPFEPKLVSSTEYRVSPPDVILLQSKRFREIDDHQEMIRPDGKLTLPLIGSLYVAGLTVEEVGELVSKKAQEFYEDAEVSARVVAYNSKKVYVFGEVSAQGGFPYDGANTILETLSLAMPTRLADASKIVILRPNRDKTKIRRMTIDFHKMIHKGDTHLDAVLEEGDIIYVPANGYAEVGYAMQQLLLPIIPASSAIRGGNQIDTGVKVSPYGKDYNAD